MREAELRKVLKREAAQEKHRHVPHPKAYFAALLLRFGKAPERAFVDRHPMSGWGVSVRSVSRNTEANDYEIPVKKFLRERFKSPGRVFCEFLRWQGAEGLIDLSVKRTTGVRKDGHPDFRTVEANRR